MTEMKIEKGKAYKRRDGLKAFDIEIDDDLASYSFELDGKIRSDDVVFVNSGLANDDARLPYEGDLIEEWKEEKMPKFKVGDFVTAEGWSNPTGHEIEKITNNDTYWLKTGYGYISPYDIEYYDSKLKLVTQTPKSPVVEKTVKSIEPGVYGIVNINNHMGKPMLTPKARNYTPEELESAAKTFMELAEYLRGRG